MHTYHTLPLTDLIPCLCPPFALCSHPSAMLLLPDASCLLHLEGEWMEWMELLVVLDLQ